MPNYDHFNPPEIGVIVREYRDEDGKSIDARKLPLGLKQVVGRVVQGGVVKSTVQFVGGDQRSIDNRSLRDAHEDENDMWEDRREWT